MLVISLDQIVSLIRITGGDWIEASLSTARKRSIRSLARSSHSPTSSLLRSGERFSTTPGSTTSLDEKITPPTIRSLETTARRRPPGSRKVFFFQAEDGIRDHCVTGVQTCALPI